MSGVESVAQALTPKLPLTGGVTVTAVTDVGAAAEAAAMLFKLLDTVVATLNSPAMLAARKNADVQAALARMDGDLAQARKSGDFAQVNRDSSG